MSSTITSQDRSRLIRLASTIEAGSALRRAILAGVSSGSCFGYKEAASPKYRDYVDRKRDKGEKPLDEEAWRSRVLGEGREKDKPSFRKNYRPKMESVMTKHRLTDDDAKQVIEFSLDRPKKGKPQPPAELKRRFMMNAKPETRERVKDMSPADFMVMLRSILDQEEVSGG